jgi:hypothetical protein
LTIPREPPSEDDAWQPDDAEGAPHATAN